MARVGEASHESETTGAGDHVPPTCPRLLSVVYDTESELDNVTLEATAECLEYREMPRAVALERLEMMYYGNGTSGTEAEFVRLTEKCVPRLLELVKRTVSLG